MAKTLTHRMLITRTRTSLLATTPTARLLKIQNAILRNPSRTRHDEEDLCWAQRELQNREEDQRRADRGGR